MYTEWSHAGLAKGIYKISPYLPKLYANYNYL